MVAKPALTNPNVLLQGAFDSARPGMALVDPRGQFVRVNPALCEIVGYPEAELRQLTFQEITHPDDLALDLENAGKTIRGEIPGYEMEKRYFRKDGAIVWIQLNVSTVWDNAGQPVCFGVHILDLTKRKAEEAGLVDEMMRRLFLEDANSDLLQTESGLHLLKVIKALSHEPSTLTQKVAAAALSRLVADPQHDGGPGLKKLLTSREQQILRLVTKGKTNKEIARTLSISPRTVEAHRATMMRKVGRGSPAELLSWATAWR